MIGYAFSKGLLAILTGYLTYKVVDYFGDKATDNDVYNKMLTENGGDEDNKKSNVGNVLAGTLAGAAGGAATGFLVGGAPGAIAGAIIGGVAGVIKTTFIPAAEAAKTSIDDMNNSLQSTSYYEGTIDGLTNKTNVYDEQLDLLNQTMEIYKEKVYTAGEDMNISKERLDELIASVENGTYSTDMLSDSELGLSDSLSSLSSQQEHAKEVSEKLTEAQKKLEKAQTDLAIVQDMEAGNFELAAARVEYALASETYEGEEAAKKMSQIMQNANSDVRTSLLDDMSGELREQWNKYIGETDSGVSDLAKILAGMNDKEKEAFSKSYADDMTDAMEDTMDAAQKVIDDTSFDWSHPLKSLKSMFTGNWDWKASYASYDVGTSYVPNDGFAYIHKGEAIIPADENVFAKQGDAWTSSMASNDKLISVMTSLENTVKQGITVSGEFTQKGADLVAAVNKASSKNGNQALSNMAYAR
jgi:exonuclease VII small subunit